MASWKQYIILVLAALPAVVGMVGEAAGAADRDIRSAQEEHTDRLMSIDGVVGTAVGSDAVLVLCEGVEAAEAVPDRVNGVSVRTIKTGRIEALSGAPRGEGAGRPVPIGVSTSARGSNDVGTIACRVTDGSMVYGLSTWHIWARGESMGSEIVQPGDSSASDAVLGTLAGYRGVSFSGVNRADAAVALTSTEELGVATPRDGYGLPSSRIVQPSLGQDVVKYGAGTELTSGTVVGVNAVLDVRYGGRVARFVDQIIVRGDGTFADRRDSGSLVVTEGANEPVGLLFAGGESGQIAAANPLGEVFAAFGVSLDNRRLTDVAITDLDASEQDGSIRVQVTVSNVGARPVNGGMDVELRVQDNGIIGSRSLSGGLSVRDAETVTFTWKPGNEAGGSESLVASHSFSDDKPENDSASVSVSAPAE